MAWEKMEGSEFTRLEGGGVRTWHGCGMCKVITGSQAACWRPGKWEGLLGKLSHTWGRKCTEQHGQQCLPASQPGTELWFQPSSSLSDDLRVPPTPRPRLGF